VVIHTCEVIVGVHLPCTAKEELVERFHSIGTQRIVDASQRDLGKEPEETIRRHGKTIEDAIAGDPTFLAPLKLFPIGSDTYFMYQGIFDTDFDKYTEYAVALFGKFELNTIFENLGGFPMDWKTNAPAFVKFVRDHHRPSFLEYGEYPYVSGRRVRHLREPGTPV
jgi:hypothetical protein